MRAIGILLPEDIWQCVASFIPHDHLLTLISVNKAFYNIVLDAKYQEIHWAKVDDRMIKSLVRLRNPSIAGRVRRLHVRAWFIEYLIQKESLVPPSYVATSKRWLSRHLRLPSTPLRIESSTSGRSSAARDILESMTAAVRLMTQVTEYSFEWRDLSPTADTLRFLTAARLAFGVSLRKLTLHAQLGNFTNLLSTVDFDNLEELELNFDHDPGDVRADVALLRDSIAPFVNHFRRSLGTLLISSASKMDLSPLFYALAPFPRLRKFAAHVAFDSAHLSDPGGLVRILRTNSDTISSVQLGRSFAASSDEALDLRSTWSGLSTAMESDPAVLSNLAALKIPALRNFDATIACLRRSANTLTSLCLVDYFLTERELVELVQIFSHRPFDAGLKSLHIGVAYMTPDLLDFLASRLPGLLNLNLVLSGLTMAEVVHSHSFTSPFCLALVGHHYPDWNLSNIGIWEKRFIDTPISTTEEMVLMEHLARCIPSVLTFKGEARSNKTTQWCRVWDV
ncbi:hypothetical protein C8R44DRAFT_706574 [Mycena epipterygia]|nr:hypothetical protein C8R44DRAFT_706574 [Mycena epipterygia]